MERKDTIDPDGSIQKRLEFLKEHKDKEKDLVSGLGFFVLRFEQMMETIRGIITEVLNKKGLTEIRYVDILLFDSTAGNLQQYFRAIMFEYCHKEENWTEILKLVDKLSNRIKNAMTIRNFLLHADYYISTHKTERLFGQRFEIEKKTGELQNKFKFTSNKDLFDEWNNEIWNLVSILIDLKSNITNENAVLERINLSQLENIKLIWPKEGEENPRGKKPERKVSGRIV